MRSEKLYIAISSAAASAEAAPSSRHESAPGTLSPADWSDGFVFPGRSELPPVAEPGALLLLGLALLALAAGAFLLRRRAVTSAVRTVAHPETAARLPAGRSSRVTSLPPADQNVMVPVKTSELNQAKL